MICVGVRRNDDVDVIRSIARPNEVNYGFARFPKAAVHDDDTLPGSCPKQITVPKRDGVSGAFPVSHREEIDLEALGHDDGLFCTRFTIAGS
jgi:hypothetical protein